MATFAHARYHIGLMHGGRPVNRSVSFLFVALALLTLGASQAAAQQGGSDLHVGAGMVVDFAGEADFGEFDDELEATIGLRLHADYEVARYVSIGGFTRFSWWETEDSSGDRNFLFDIGPRLQGHYDWRDFRFYVAAMPGLLISKVDDDGNNIDNPAAGFTMSIAPGVEYWFNNKVAVYTEIFGWVGHYFDHDYENSDADIDINMNQVAFNFGVVFAP